MVSIETVSHKYYGKEYELTITEGHWFLDCSDGAYSGTLPINPKEVNKAIRLWKVDESGGIVMKDVDFRVYPTCKGCKKSPSEITEYKFNPEGMDPTEFVKKYERPTLDGHFYCTTCYIKVGMPSF